MHEALAFKTEMQELSCTTEAPNFESWCCSRYREHPYSLTLGLASDLWGHLYLGIICKWKWKMVCPALRPQFIARL